MRVCGYLSIRPRCDSPRTNCLGRVTIARKKNVKGVGMFRRFFYYLGLTAGGLVIVACLALGAYIYSVSRGLPGVDQLKDYQPPVTTRVYASNGDLLGEYARERRFFVP